MEKVFHGQINLEDAMLHKFKESFNISMHSKSSMARHTVGAQDPAGGGAGGRLATGGLRGLWAGGGGEQGEARPDCCPRARPALLWLGWVLGSPLPFFPVLAG